MIFLLFPVTICGESISNAQSLTFGEPDNVIHDENYKDYEGGYNYNNENEHSFERWKRSYYCSWESGRQDMDSSFSLKLHPNSLLFAFFVLLASSLPCLFGDLCIFE